MLLLSLAFCIAFVIIALITGYNALKKDHKASFEEREFGVKYYDSFIEVLDSRSKGRINQKKLTWLKTQADKIQGNLGDAGLMVYRNPIQGMIYNNYPVVINEIPKLDENYLDPFTPKSLDNILLRNIGLLNRNLEATEKNLKNKSKWLSVGIVKIFSIPLSILEAFNIIGTSRAQQVAKSPVYRVLSGIVVLSIAIISILGNVVTIIQGYEPSKQLLIKQIIDSSKAIPLRQNMKAQPTKKSLSNVDTLIKKN